MWKIIIITGLVILLLYVGGFFLAVWTQERLIYPVQQNVSQDCEKSVGEDVVVRDGAYLHHKHKEESDTVVVFYHGNGDTVCDVAFLGDIFDEEDVSYIFPEYIGYSGDGEKASHEGVLKTVEETVKFINEKEYKNVYVIGQSIGSGAAAYHAELQGPERLLLISPFTTLTNVVSDMFPFYPHFLIEKFFDDQFDSQKRLKDYKNELIVIHGTKDPVVRLVQGKKLFNSIPSESKKFITAKGYGHANLRESQEMIEAVRGIIR